MKNNGVRRSQAEEPKIECLRLDRLRQGIRSNRISFPAQVPIFEKHDRPDLQRKIVQLYFVLGWSCSSIALRYGLIRQRVQQILTTWKRRAAEMGYVQHIPPAEDFVSVLAVQPRVAESPEVLSPEVPSIPNFVPPVRKFPELPRSL
jgi:hypothetical protein